MKLLTRYLKEYRENSHIFHKLQLLEVTTACNAGGAKGMLEIINPRNLERVLVN